MMCQMLFSGRNMKKNRLLKFLPSVQSVKREGFTGITISMNYRQKY